MWLGYQLSAIGSVFSRSQGRRDSLEAVFGYTVILRTQSPETA